MQCFQIPSYESLQNAFLWNKKDCNIAHLVLFSNLSIALAEKLKKVRFYEFIRLRHKKSNQLS